MKITARDVTLKKINKIEKYLSAHQGDVKFRQGYLSTTPTITGDVAYLSALAQGDDASTRTGNAINLHKVAVNTIFKMTGTCAVRVIVFRDKMNQGLIPSVNDVLDSSDVIAPLNYLNFVIQKRFVLIEDYIHHFTVGGILSATHYKEVNHDCKVRYSGSGGTFTSALANNIYALTITDTASAGNLNIYSRLLFTDE